MLNSKRGSISSCGVKDLLVMRSSIDLDC
jgi:hypothetical protein